MVKRAKHRTPESVAGRRLDLSFWTGSLADGEEISLALNKSRGEGPQGMIQKNGCKNLVQMDFNGFQICKLFVQNMMIDCSA